MKPLRHVVCAAAPVALLVSSLAAHAAPAALVAAPDLGSFSRGRYCRHPPAMRVRWKRPTG